MSGRLGQVRGKCLPGIDVSNRIYGLTRLGRWVGQMEKLADCEKRMMEIVGRHVSKNLSLGLSRGHFISDVRQVRFPCHVGTLIPKSSLLA